MNLNLNHPIMDSAIQKFASISTTPSNVAIDFSHISTNISNNKSDTPKRTHNTFQNNTPFQFQPPSFGYIFNQTNNNNNSTNSNSNININNNNNATTNNNVYSQRTNELFSGFPFAPPDYLGRYTNLSRYTIILLADLSSLNCILSDFHPANLDI